MERSTTATFIGHSECYGLDEGRVLATIEQLVHAGITTFLCGGMGRSIGCVPDRYIMQNSNIQK